jgi:hypothetical protein
MKWGGFKIQGWDDAWKAVLSIAIVIIIVFMLVDFISWRTALDIIKKDLPISGPVPSIFIRGYGYIPFVWHGNFKRISIDASGTSTSVGDVTDLILQMGDHNPFWMHIKGGYGDYIAKLIPDLEGNEWYNQEFRGISVYVKVIPIKYYLTDHYHCDIKILVFAETEEKHYLRQVKATLTWSCGQYWYGGWYK